MSFIDITPPCLNRLYIRIAMLTSAAGKSSRSPSPKVDKSPASTKPVENTDKAKPVIPKPNTSSAKRKLVGGDSADSKPATVLSKKKKKAAKGLLSFDEADGEN